VTDGRDRRRISTIADHDGITYATGRIMGATGRITGDG